MSLIKKYAGTSGDRVRVSDGTYPARVIEIFDIGRQKGEYEGEPYNKPTLWLSFEFPTVTKEFNGELKPLRLSGEFTRSTNEKSKLFKVINACDKDVATFQELLGKACLVEVGSTKGGNAKFVAAMGLPDGMTVAPLFGNPLYYDIAHPNTEVFNTFPTFLKEKIMGSDDYVKPSATGISREEAFDTPF